MLKRNALIYLTGTLVQRGLPFALMPVYTRLMSVEEFGIYGTYIALLGLLSLGVGLKPEAYLIKTFTQDEQHFSSAVAGSVFLIPISLVFVAPIAFVASRILFSEDAIDVNSLFILSLATAVCLAARCISESIFLARGQAYTFTLIQIGFGLLTAIATVGALIYIEPTWEIRAVTELSLNLLLIALTAGVILANASVVSLAVLWSSILSATKFLFPLLGHVAAFTFLNVGDRLVLQSLIGAEAVGLYAAGYMLGMLIGVLHEGLLRAWTPYFFGNVEKSTAHERKVFQLACLYSVFSLLAGLLFGVAMSYCYQYILPPQYVGLGLVILLASLSYSLEGVRKAFVGYLYTNHKTKSISAISILAAVMNVGLNIALVPKYGLVGAAWATLFAFLLMSAATVAMATRERGFLLAKLGLAKELE